MEESSMSFWNKSKWDTRRREGDETHMAVDQKFTRVRPVEFDGCEVLAHREGGAYPLYVKQTQPGMFVSTWMINARHCREFIREMTKHPRRDVVLSIVLDTNVPGHPTISLQLQEIFIVPDEPAKKD